MGVATEPRAVSTVRNNPYLLRLVFMLFCMLIVMRFVLNANLLNTMMNYSDEGGSIIEKIHPSTYGLIIVLLATVFLFRIELTEWELRVLRSFIVFVAAIGILSAFIWSLGHSGSVGYLIDTYVVACIAAVLMLPFPQAWRESIGTIVIGFIAISACVAIAEFALHARLLPYSNPELSFRPTGLTEHPLVLGLFNAVAIWFVPLTRWKLFAKIGVTFILLLGAFAAGARVASIVAAVSAFAVVMLHQRVSVPRVKLLQRKLLFIIAAAVAIPIMLVLLVQLGLVDRFQRGFDDSAMARVNIYGLFDLVSWSEILLGTNISRIRAMALEYFDLETIESSLIMFIFQFGLLGMIFFLLFVARTFFTLVSGAGRHVVLGTCAFFIIAGSNNALSSKGATVLVIVMLIVAFHHRSRMLNLQ
jgi:hypothetical protein